MTNVRAAEVRRALEALPAETSFGDAPPLGNVYFPQSHLKALHPDVAVITGMRGAGKTFWWAALQKHAVRELIGKRYERSGIRHNTELRTGFGPLPAIDEYPTKDVLHALLEDGIDARMIWRTVLAWQLAREIHILRQQGDWRARVSYVRHHPEEIDRIFAERDAKLADEGRHCIVICDALDRSADDWRTMYRIIRGLLQTALDMRTYRRLRVKMFLRTDQFNPAAIGDFPDASKLLSSAVKLSWPRKELYGLLWQLLCNAPRQSERMRELIGGGQSELLTADDDGTWQVPPALVFDEAHQREAFHAIAGEWMGRDRRRGFPYTWIPNHLGDAEGNVSPRSFIAALRAAAEDSGQQYPRHECALHYESIKRGVQQASRIRVAELREDYPWVDRLLQDLQGATVPCPFEDIEWRWKQNKTLTRLDEDIEQQEVKLPPRRFAEGAEGVRADLESLNVFQRLHDARVNIPDVFRVGYGLGRRGGVRPVR